ncbi:MAG TPA: hypothetical protein VHZ81_12055 [Galbitalea sp.]|nr:hypothetical protein [Galbitalea sp.]
MGRRAGRGQTAGSALELAWDDALRSRALNSFVITPFFLGTYFGSVAFEWYPPARGIGETIGPDMPTSAAAVLILVWAIAGMISKPQRRYLRRLWPELAAAGATASATPAGASHS